MEADHAKSLDIAANRTLTERNRITELLRDIDENKYVNLALTHFKRLRIATNDFCITTILFFGGTGQSGKMVMSSA